MIERDLTHLEYAAPAPPRRGVRGQLAGLSSLLALLVATVFLALAGNVAWAAFRFHGDGYRGHRDEAIYWVGALLVLGSVCSAAALRWGRHWRRSRGRKPAAAAARRRRAGTVSDRASRCVAGR